MFFTSRSTVTLFRCFLGYEFLGRISGLEYVRMRVMLCKTVKLDFEHGCSNMLVVLSQKVIALV